MPGSDTSATVGSIPPIPDDLASSTLDTAILTDALKIQAYKEDIAAQLNKQSGGPQFKDLSERISGVRIETSAQGASLLTLTLTDPLWVLPMSGFIQVDDGGYLWPPIDVNFPRGTDCFWRLCQYDATWDAEMTAANLTLTFEDRIVSLLREMSAAYPGGISQGRPNQTLGGFIKQLVDNANHNISANIRLVELISPQDPNYTLPATTPGGGGRQDPLKQNKGLTSSQQSQLAAALKAEADLFGSNAPPGTPGTLLPPGVPWSLAGIEANAPTLIAGASPFGNPNAPPQVTSNPDQQG